MVPRFRTAQLLLLAGLALAACGTPADPRADPEDDPEDDPPAEPALPAEYALLFPDAPTGGPDRYLYRVQGDGSGRMLLGGGSRCPHGSWSPDGEEIAYSLGGDVLWCNAWSSGGIRLITATGGNPRTITDGVLDSRPTWSPDGRTIAFAGSSGGLYIIASDGTGLTQIVAGGQVAAIHWSTDGTRITYWQEGWYDVDAAAGATPEPATAPPPHDDLSPDGKWRATDDDGWVVVSSIDGTVSRRITPGCCAQWQPRPDG